MRKTMIVVAAAVLAVGSTSLSTSASAFGLVPLGGFGLIHPGFALGHLGGLGLVHPGPGLAHPGGGFAFARPGEGYGLGHFDGSFGGHALAARPITAATTMAANLPTAATPIALRLSTAATTMADSLTMAARLTTATTPMTTGLTTATPPMPASLMTAATTPTPPPADVAADEPQRIGDLA